MVDTNGFNIIQEEAYKTKVLIEAGRWLDAKQAMSDTITAITSEAVHFDFYNILTKEEFPWINPDLPQGKYFSDNIRSSKLFEEIILLLPSFV